MADKMQYSLDVENDYVHLKMWDQIHVSEVHKPIDAAVALANEHHIHKLLDDISDIDLSSVNVAVQSKAIGLMWKLRNFKKIAVVYDNGEVGGLVRGSIEATQLFSRCRAFDNQADAIAWLEAETSEEKATS